MLVDVWNRQHLKGNEALSYIEDLMSHGIFFLGHGILFRGCPWS